VGGVSDGGGRGEFCNFDEVPLDAVDEQRHARGDHVFVAAVFGLHGYLAQQLFVFEQQRLQLCHLPRLFFYL